MPSFGMASLKGETGMLGTKVGKLTKEGGTKNEEKE